MAAINVPGARLEPSRPAGHKGLNLRIGFPTFCDIALLPSHYCMFYRRCVRKIGTQRKGFVTEQLVYRKITLLPAPSKRKMPPWIADPLIDDLDDQVSLNPRPAPLTNPCPAFCLRISAP